MSESTTDTPAWVETDEEVYQVARAIYMSYYPSATTDEWEKVVREDGVMFRMCLALAETSVATAGPLIAARARAEALQPIRDLHRPWYVVAGHRHDMTVVVGADDLPADHVCRTDDPNGDNCVPEYDEHHVLACVECIGLTSDSDPGHQLWPCRTRKAIDASGATAPTTGEQR